MKILDGSPPSTAIRTPDQRLRVFVSSTLKELAAERAAARTAIEQLRLAPVMFESGARVHPPQAVYRAYLGQSDIFIGIYWQRYGWVGPGMTISGLEDELRLAASMPRLLYLRVPAPDLEPGLGRMLDDIRAEGTASYKTFTDAGELGELIAGDLAMILAERFSTPAIARASPLATRCGGGLGRGAATGRCGGRGSHMSIARALKRLNFTLKKSR